MVQTGQDKTQGNPLQVKRRAVTYGSTHRPSQYTIEGYTGTCDTEFIPLIEEEYDRQLYYYK